MNALRRFGGASALIGAGTLLAIWTLASSPPQPSAATSASSAPVLTQTAAGLPEFRDIVRNNKASIVSISTRQRIRNTAFDEGSPFEDLPEDSPFRDFFRGFGGRAPVPQDREAQGLGSGFIVSADGKILTNAHVVDGADTVTVRLADRAEYQAKVVGKDTATDVALLKIDAKNLPAVRLGDSDKLEVGEWVLAIGSPFGLDYSATQGIVSALGRSLPNETYVPFIQTDVAVNPGNSGGPLFNTRGEVVGINSQIYSRSGGYMGLSFAVPINTAHYVAQQLEQAGYVSRGWLGVQIQTVTGELAESFGLDKPRGALVGSVDKEGPAAKAGVRGGDIITSYDGHAVNDSSDLPPLVGGTPVGRTVEMKVLRDGKEVTLRPTIAQLKDEDSQADTRGEKSAQGKALLNMSVQSLSTEMRERLGVREGGVLVAQVNPGPAARAGVREGDVILKVGNKDVETAQQFIKLVQDLPRGKPVAFLVQREQGRLYLPVTLPADESGGKG